MSKYPWKTDDWLMFDKYDGSSAVIDELQQHFSQKFGMEVPRFAICRMASYLKKARTKEPDWTLDDVGYLIENYGRVPDKTLCQHLGRSRTAITLKAKRLGINRKMNILTSRSVAEICGVPDPKTVIFWVRKGFLKANRSTTSCGRNRMWNIHDDSLAQMLKQHPWLARLDKMPESWYRTIVENEWTRDPWYFFDQAARFIGIKAEYHLLRYIRRGWLRGERMPGGAKHGNYKWVFRASWLMEFLANDPRDRYHRKAMAISKHAKRLLHEGEPIALFDMWMLLCPRCGQAVAVKTKHSKAFASTIKNHFEISLDGHTECVHGTFVDLTTTLLEKMSPPSQPIPEIEWAGFIGG